MNKIARTPLTNCYYSNFGASLFELSQNLIKVYFLEKIIFTMIIFFFFFLRTLTIID